MSAAASLPVPYHRCTLESAVKPPLMPSAAFAGPARRTIASAAIRPHAALLRDRLDAIDSPQPLVEPQCKCGTEGPARIVYRHAPRAVDKCVRRLVHLEQHQRGGRVVGHLVKHGTLD